MNDNRSSKDKTVDPVTTLLRKATPRKSAPDAVRDRAFKRLHAQWSQKVNKRNRRIRSVTWGMAASLVLAIGAVALVNMTPAPDSGIVIVADALRVEGNVVVSNVDRIEAVQELFENRSIVIGDVIKTDNTSSLAMRWGNSGSLRIAANTQITILDPKRIELSSGKVYYDSQAQPFGTVTRTAIAIETPYAEVTHVGTQFIADVSNDLLTVRTREGVVQLEHAGAKWQAPAGRALTLSSSGESQGFDVDNRGEEWEWVHNIAPAFDSEGRSADSLLMWIGRELGYTVLYDDDLAKHQSKVEILNGLSPLPPARVLETLPIVTELKYHVRGDAIHVSFK